jgi:hypothetical protein
MPLDELLEGMPLAQPTPPVPPGPDIKQPVKPRAYIACGAGKGLFTSERSATLGTGENARDYWVSADAVVDRGPPDARGVVPAYLEVDVLSLEDGSGQTLLPDLSGVIAGAKSANVLFQDLGDHCPRILCLPLEQVIIERKPGSGVYEPLDRILGQLRWTKV